MESLIRLTSTVAPDFNVMFLAAGDLLKSLNPYLNPFIFTGVGYPPNTLLFYLFFNLFPYFIAQNIFLAVSTISLIFSLLISFKITGRKLNPLSFSACLLLTVLSFPTKFTLGMGQNNFIALILLLLSYFFFSEKKDILSGIFLGLVISFKTIFVFFLFFYILKRKWKTVIFAFLTILFLVLLTGGLFGWNLYGFYFSKVVPPLLDLKGREIYYNQGILGFVSRITTDLCLRKYVTFFISVVIISISSLFSIRKKDNNLQFSLFIISLCLIDSLSWQHHFVWLIFPYMVITDKLFRKRGKTGLIFLMISYFLVSINFKNYQSISFLDPFFLSHVFLGSILLYVLNLKALIGNKKWVWGKVKK